MVASRRRTCRDRVMKRMAVRILLAVGDSSIAARFGNALEIAGFEVVVVACGADAVRVCAQRAPDMLVCDAGLPDVDALQLARRLRRKGAPFPVILIADEPQDECVCCTNRGLMPSVSPPIIPSPCDEQRLVDLLLELASEPRPVAPGCLGFPTHVIWPTACRRLALSTR